MLKFAPLYFCAFFLFACSGESNSSETNEETTSELKDFEGFEEKISYCIGLDHGASILNAYNNPQTAGKFSDADLEAGLTDYLSDAELRISIFSIDSVLNLYLGENGTVRPDQVSKSDASYALGLAEAQTLVGSLVGRGIDQRMNIDLLVAGIHDGMNNQSPRLPLNQARKEVYAYYSDINKELGRKFLDDNATKENIQVTESGLQYEVISAGNGITPNLTDSVTVHYTGRFIDGRVFESTIPSGRPAKFTPMGVIQGWQEGLLLMKEGASYRFFIPYELAYGERGSGPIEPYTALVFDIELLKVKRFDPKVSQ